MAPILGIYASQMSGHLTLPSSYYSIATQTVGSGGASSVTFSSIPSTYTHLQIRATSAGNNNTAVLLAFNGDASSGNYSVHDLKAGQGYGSSIYSDGSANINYGVFLDQQTGNATYWNGTVADIYDYANTNKYKTMRDFTGVDNNGNGFIYMYSSVWRNTAAITSISLYPYTSYFFANSSFALYGVK